MAIPAVSENAITQNAPLFTGASLRRLMIPLIIEQGLNMAVGMVDTMMVASIGERAVSGVSLADSITALLIQLFAALATGGAIVAGQYLGARKKEKAADAAKQLLIVSTALGAVVMLVCLLLNRQILQLIFGSVEAGVMSEATGYFGLVTLSYPFVACANAGAALFRGMGNSKVTMTGGMLMNVLNIACNALFIFGFGMGVAGAALGTVIARLGGAAFMVIRLRSPKNEISVRSYDPRSLRLPMLKRILGIGIPSGLENSIFYLGRIIMTGLVATFGTVSIAAHAVGSSLTVLGVIPGQAAGLALTTVVARCIGAKDTVQAKKYTRQIMKWTYALMLALNAALLLLLGPILSLYSLSDAAHSLVFQIVWIHSLGLIVIWPMSFTLPNALRAASDVKFPMCISILSMFVFRIGGSFALAYLFQLGVLSVWIAMLIDWTFRSICFLWRWKKGSWQAAGR